MIPQSHVRFMTSLTIMISNVPTLIRSLYRNIDEIRVFLHNNAIHILVLNETLLDDSISDNELHIRDYNLIRKDRNRNGGGVAIYIRNSISYDLINSVVLDPLELLLIKVRPKSSTPFLFLSWYRPPDIKIEIMDKYESALAFVDSFHSNVIVMGDVNCGIRKVFKSNVIKRYEVSNKLYSMEQVNTTQYTRVTHIVGSIYSLTPNKLLQKVFQRIWVVFNIINNILKVPQNPTSGKLLFSKWRPRWPP